MTNLYSRQGDTLRRTLTVRNSDGTLADLTGATLRFNLRHGAATVLTQPLTADAPSTGVATLTLSAVQTAALDASVPYRYEVELTDVLAAVTTLVDGWFVIGTDDG